MADHELHTRTYDTGVSVELRANRGAWMWRQLRDGTPIKDHWNHLDPGPHGETAVRQFVDEMVALNPAFEWQRVIECPACLTRAVSIERFESQDAYAVACPSCRSFEISGLALRILGDQRTAGPSQLVDLAFYLRSRADNDDSHVSAESWQWMTQEGARRRRQAP